MRKTARLAVTHHTCGVESLLLQPSFRPAHHMSALQGLDLSHMHILAANKRLTMRIPTLKVPTAPNVRSARDMAPLATVTASSGWECWGAGPTAGRRLPPPQKPRKPSMSGCASRTSPKAKPPGHDACAVGRSQALCVVPLACRWHAGVVCQSSKKDVADCKDLRGALGLKPGVIFCMHTTAWAAAAAKHSSPGPIWDPLPYVIRSK